jgi:hypothetical protein
MSCGLSRDSVDLEVAVVEEMALSIFGSNNIERVGLGREDTMQISMDILVGDTEFEYSEW